MPFHLNCIVFCGNFKIKLKAKQLEELRLLDV